MTVSSKINESLMDDFTLRNTVANTYQTLRHFRAMVSSADSRGTMRKLLLTTAAAVLLSTPTLAADLAPMPAEPVAPTYLPFTWAGPYVGVQVGYGWGDENDNQSFNFPEPDPEPADEFDMDGFLGGVHAGYNWQMGALVLGVEGDVEFSTYEGDTDFLYESTDPDIIASGNLSMESDWQASLRLRAGFAVDRLLVYATGGVAFADAELSVDGTTEGDLVGSF